MIKAKTKYRTEQENFWAGEFGNDYVARNANDSLLAAKIRLFSTIVSRTNGLKSAIEFGPNIGLNLTAIQTLLPGTKLAAVEINPHAAKLLEKRLNVDVKNASLLDFRSTAKFDFVLAQGVLIHLNPKELPRAYDVLYKTSRRYVCVAEYYSRNPEALPYRGHSEKLFKRDFAGEILDRFKDLTLVDYGFVYHRDPVLPLDDVSWFLMEKRK